MPQGHPKKEPHTFGNMDPDPQYNKFEKGTLIGRFGD